MYTELFLLLVGLFIFAIYLKIKMRLNDSKWRVVIHSFESNKKLYEFQHTLNRNGIKSRIETDEALTSYAIRSYYTGDKGTILKLLVQEKDLPLVRRLLEDQHVTD